MPAAGLLLFLTAYPPFLLLTQRATFAVMITVMVWLGSLKACSSGVLRALMSEMFPTATRASGLSVSYNIGVTIFGGFAPLIITWMIDITGSSLSPSFYLLGCTFISLAALLTARESLGLR